MVGYFAHQGALSKGIEGSVLVVPRWLRFRSGAAPEPRPCDLSKNLYLAYVTRALVAHWHHRPSVIDE